DACRAAAWARDAACQLELSACWELSRLRVGPSPSLSNILEDCAEAIGDCNAPVDCVSPEEVEPRWPSRYPSAWCPEDPNAAPSSDGPDAPAVDRWAGGRLGPMPQNGGCPDCRLSMRASSNDPVLDIEINRELKLGTRFGPAEVSIYVPNRYGMTVAKR